MGRIRTPVSVVVLALNEEVHMEACLQSVAGWAREVFVVDSFSSDRTIELARKNGAEVVQNRFEGYSQQRNWALDHLTFSNDWVFFLDADETFTPELRAEIASVLAAVPPEIAGFYVKRRFFFMGRWIKHGGYYPIWILRLLRRQQARCSARQVNEHFYVEGQTAYLQHDLLHENRHNLAAWIDKHNRYAALEAAELMVSRNPTARNNSVQAAFWGSQSERKQWIRYHAWDRLPLLVRPFIYFFYRYFLLGGFLDGHAGLIYHSMQGLWFPLLIDAKYMETRYVRHHRPVELG